MLKNRFFWLGDLDQCQFVLCWTFILYLLLWSIRIEDTEKRSVETLGLIDSGAGGKFIDQNYAKKMGFKTYKLEKPLQAYNVDGTKNKRGTMSTSIWK